MTSYQGTKLQLLSISVSGIAADDRSIEEEEPCSENKKTGHVNPSSANNASINKEGE
jgi:hypothetical protein